MVIKFNLFKLISKNCLKPNTQIAYPNKNIPHIEPTKANPLAPRGVNKINHKIVLINSEYIAILAAIFCCILAYSQSENSL